ncbi:MAG TPA: HAD family phosphatase [Verrucomicrobiae bacterium]|nr:HAD family phosphatase [Verrucomicrobiae bacterium]
MAPKVVVFDLGKVLVDFDYSIAGRNLAAMSKVPANQMQEILEKSRLLVEFETGLTNRDQFFRNVCDATGYCGDQAKFNVLFADIFTGIEPMIEFHAELRKKGIPTYIFSNTNDLAVTHIRSRFPFFSTFDGYVFSYEHGSMKPQRKIYEVVERMTRMRGPEICYIDDRLENVEGGKAMGWQTIWHKSPEQTIATYRSLAEAPAK